VNEIELKKLLKQIISVDKTPDYVDFSDEMDEDKFLNANKVAPKIACRWCTPREICNEWLKDIERGTLNDAVKLLMGEDEVK